MLHNWNGPEGRNKFSFILDWNWEMMRDAIQIVNKFLLTGTVHLIDLIHTPITRTSLPNVRKWGTIRGSLDHDVLVF